VLPAPPITIDQFTKRVESAENKVTGERLWRILDAAEKFIEYLVADTNGVVTRRLGKVDVTEARVAIGLPPKAKSRMPRRVERLQQVFPMAAE
jgi:hypothetical protein